MSMEELLQALMGGGGAAKRRGASGGDPLTDMLQGVLGGGAAKGQSGSGLEDLLGSILGGAAGQGKSAQSAQGGGLMDILGAVMGGGSGMQGPGTSPIVEGIAGKLGLPQGIAQMILAFVVGKLAAGMLGGGGASLPGATPQSRSRATTPQQPQSLNLDSLLETMGQDRSMADELAQQTGLDPQTAQRGLQEVLSMIGAQSQAQGGASAQPKQGGLDNLLDSW